jgi:hypothetical protein
LRVVLKNTVNSHGREVENGNYRLALSGLEMKLLSQNGRRRLTRF